jgi:hypothetical protein
MGAAAKPRCAVVFLMVLALGVSLGLPTEDVLDAVYDESESLPFEMILSVANVVLPVTAVTTQAPLSPSRLKVGAPSPVQLAHFRDTDANRPTGARISLALLCTLLC